ncbi:VOC family protein [Agaribacter marinus]|uniref:Glyoxalase n=1 Tax=Agaribacter marinus TaxID=1431249 RepID=A0AA37T2D7_9ALTE|nr:VOC family protein [Agaribacter marinus]GLR72674.1 glyoxalase [Agaribacter marinus]
MHQHHHINYVEFHTRDIAANRKFFEAVFSWSFTEYGPDYLAFKGSGIEGGFFKSDKHNDAKNGGALVVILSDDLEASQQAVESNGGKVIVPIFSFPGGRRFHFSDPNNNEWAVWSLVDDGTH